MSVTVSPVFLRESASRQAVEAELRDAISEQQLIDWEDLWQPALAEVLQRLRDSGVDRAEWPQSRYWNWRAKADAYRDSLANSSLCVVCQGVTQGMMILDTLHSARLPSQKGKALIYIEYLEVAPWNRRHFVDEVPRYGSVGSILLRAAIECSLQSEFKGRIGLHSLPQSNAWYANACNMADLGPDADYPNHLRYFEMTPEMAETFIAKGHTP